MHAEKRPGVVVSSYHNWHQGKKNYTNEISEVSGHNEMLRVSREEICIPRGHTLIFLCGIQQNIDNNNTAACTGESIMDV